jgi:hypothetical protein
MKKTPVWENRGFGGQRSSKREMHRSPRHRNTASAQPSTFPVCDIHKLSDHVMQPDAGPEPVSDLRNMAGGQVAFEILPAIAGCCGWWLGGEGVRGRRGAPVLGAYALVG